MSDDLRNYCKTGWTTNELLSEIYNKNEPLVNLVLCHSLIGVNNQYRGGNPEVYREEFKVLAQ